METQDRIFYQGVELSREGVGEWRKGQRTGLVARPVVRDIALARGFVEERIVARFILGGICALFGVLSILGVIAGGWELSGLLIIGLIIGPIGTILLVRALRRGAYLRVTTTVGEQKVVFDGPIDDRQLATSLERARRDFDLPPAR